MSEKSNGRVDILQPPNKLLFDLQDKAVLKSTSYTDAVQGIYYNTDLSDTYFSADNVQILQNGIRAGVYKKSKDKFVIKEQDTDTLKVIMRSIFLQHAVNSPNKIKEQIERLNNLVLTYAIPKVYGEAIGYINYCKDASTIHEPLTPPVMSRINDKQLEPNLWL
jgi:hypothetical protein